jgi:hypothetical protein
MSSDITTENQELFVDVSNQQQENTSGGCSFHSGDSMYNLFFQKTDIETFSNSAINVSGGNAGSKSGGISSIQQTGYRFSQITFGISMPSRGITRGISRGRRSDLLSTLFSMMSFF